MSQMFVMLINVMSCHIVFTCFVYGWSNVCVYLIWILLIRVILCLYCLVLV